MAGSKKTVDRLKEKQLKDQLPKDECNQEYKENTATITTKSLNISTLDEALGYSKVDMKVWEVDRYIINSWEVTAGAKYCKDELLSEAETYTNYQVKVWLKRKVIKPIEVAIKELLKDKKPPKYPKIVYKKLTDPMMLEISLYDHHFGLLAWRKETTEDYDLKIAKSLYQKAIVDILSKVQHYNIEKIVFPIGQDFFHIDNEEGLTPKGKNRLDKDARLAKIYNTGLWATIKAIETCLTVAPVNVEYVKGNHDIYSSFYLCTTLQHRFWENKHVKVNAEPIKRKYVRYGQSLIGFTHFDAEPIKKLPLLMADECKKDWAETEFHEIHGGHLHKKKEIFFSGADSEGSVVVRYCPSLCGTDVWHYEHGYVKGFKAAESHLYSEKEGYVGHFSTNKYNL